MIPVSKHLQSIHFWGFWFFRSLPCIAKDACRVATFLLGSFVSTLSSSQPKSHSHSILRLSFAVVAVRFRHVGSWVGDSIWGHIFLGEWSHTNVMVTISNMFCEVPGDWDEKIYYVFLLGIDVYDVISSIQRYGCRDASFHIRLCFSRPRFKRCFGKNPLKMTWVFGVFLKIISPRCKWRYSFDMPQVPRAALLCTTTRWVRVWEKIQEHRKEFRNEWMSLKIWVQSLTHELKCGQPLQKNMWNSHSMLAKGGKSIRTGTTCLGVEHSGYQFRFFIAWTISSQLTLQQSNIAMKDEPSEGVLPTEKRTVHCYLMDACELISGPAEPVFVRGAQYQHTCSTNRHKIENDRNQCFVERFSFRRVW